MMMFLAALCVFVASHVLVARTAVKPWLQSRLGQAGYLAAYSALSVGLLAGVVLALLAAPRLGLWGAPDWAHGFALAGTFLAFTLLGAGIATPNPLSVSFRKDGYDPARPGLVGWVRHPVLSGFGLWGLAHVPANGDWPSLGLFAGSLLFAGFGARSLDRRVRQRLGDAGWRALQPGRGHITGHALWGAVSGILVWAAMLALHPVLFGVDPLAVLAR